MSERRDEMAIAFACVILKANLTPEVTVSADLVANQAIMMADTLIAKLDEKKESITNVHTPTG